MTDPSLCPAQQQKMSDLADRLLTLSDVEQSFGRNYNAQIMREAQDALRPAPVHGVRKLIENLRADAIRSEKITGEPKETWLSWCAAEAISVLSQGGISDQGPLCPGGIDPGFEECPKCGASMDDACAGMSAPVEEKPDTFMEDYKRDMLRGMRETTIEECAKIVEVTGLRNPTNVANKIRALSAVKGDR